VHQLVIKVLNLSCCNAFTACIQNQWSSKYHKWYKVYKSNTTKFII